MCMCLCGVHDGNARGEQTFAQEANICLQCNVAEQRGVSAMRGAWVAAGCVGAKCVAAWGIWVESWGDVGYRGDRMQHTPLTGTHECKLDDRSRLAIPAKMRWAFADGVVMAAWLDPCAIVVPREAMQRKIQSVFGNVDNVLDDNQRRLRRFLYSSMTEQDSLDKQGRILIPSLLRTRAGLESTVTVVGSDDFIELWNPQRFEAHIQAMDEEGVSNIGKRIVERDS